MVAPDSEATLTLFYTVGKPRGQFLSLCWCGQSDDVFAHTIEGARQILAFEDIAANKCNKVTTGLINI